MVISIMEKTSLTVSKSYTELPVLDFFKLHTHDVYELFCFLSGSADYYVEGSIYNLKKGDILIMKKAESHRLLIKRSLPYERIVVNFSRDDIYSELSEKIINFIDNRPLGKYNKYSISDYKEKNLLYFLERMTKTETTSEKKLYLNLILNELCAKYPTSESETANNDFSGVVAYINEHLTEEISVGNLAKVFFMSKTHFSRQFKKLLGSTAWEYITAKRLIIAKELLSQGEKPTEIFSKIGFNDYCTFYKAYRSRFGNSPKQDYKVNTKI